MGVLQPQQATVRHRQSRGQEVTTDEKRSEWQGPHLKTDQSLDGSGSKNKCGERKWGGPVPDISEDGVVSLWKVTVSNMC